MLGYATLNDLQLKWKIYTIDKSELDLRDELNVAKWFKRYIWMGNQKDY